MTDIYREVIMDHYRNPRNFGILKNASSSISLRNPLCGDSVRLDILFQNDTIKNIKFSGSGCVISQSAASLLTQEALGKRKAQLLNIDRTFMMKLLGVEVTSSRIQCLLLPAEALVKILNDQNYET